MWYYIAVHVVLPHLEKPTVLHAVAATDESQHSCGRRREVFAEDGRVKMMTCFSFFFLFSPLIQQAFTARSDMPHNL